MSSYSGRSKASTERVETYDEAKGCAELFKSKADTIDGVIVTLPNFGDERAIAGRRDCFCGATSTGRCTPTRGENHA